MTFPEGESKSLKELIRKEGKALALTLTFFVKSKIGALSSFFVRSSWTEKGEIMQTIFQEMAERWPSCWVARTEAEKFTGGLISEKYLANLDCVNKGPAGRIRIGRKIVYPVQEFIKWLEARSEVIPERGK